MDFPVDDGDLCTLDTCVVDDDGAAMAVNTPVECPEGEACDPDTGDCVNLCEGVVCDDTDVCTDDTCDPVTGECIFTPADCDDEVACTDDSCDADTGDCVNTDNCLAGQECNLDTGDCDPIPCDTPADCDDGLFCNGPETCSADSICEAGINPCPDDGVFCNGTESCDEDADECTSSGDPCAADETCNEDTDLCEAQPACDDDNPCVDDGLFCNGIDVCQDGVCIAGADPCADTVCTCAGEAQDTICAEGDTAASCSCPTCPTIEFTLGQDNLAGSTGDDTFSAPLVFNIQSGTQIATLQTGDSANGLAGNDVLNASFNVAGTVVPQSLAGIETINITNFSAGTVTLSSTNISGVDTITSVTSVNDVTITGLQELTDCGFKDINDTTVDLALTFAQSSSTSGSADTFTCTLENATVGILTVTTNAANGFETMSFVSNGTVANRLTTLTQTTGNTMATANFTGTANLRVDTLPTTVLTYNASAMTGNLQLGTGTEDTTYAEFATANLTQITGGSGDDTFIFEDTFTSADFSTSGETLDCGAGTDVVQNSFAATVGGASKLRNCEEVRFNASATASVNFSGHTGLTTITIEEDGGATAFTLLNVPATSGVFPSINFRGDNTQAAQTYDTITYTAVGATGSSDSLAITVGNRGTALNSGTSTTNVHTIGGAVLTAAGFEVITINVSDGPATFNGLTATALTTLTITGSSNVTMGTISPVAATGLVQLDASAVTGNFSATIADLATGGVITTGAGNDTIVITAGSPGTSSSITLGAGNDIYTGDATTASADTIDAGAGTDTIQPGDGADTVTTGSGADTVIYDQVLAVDEIDISDFTAGTGGDIMRFDISDLALAGGTEFVGAVGSVAVISSEEILVLTGVAYATDEAAEDAVAARVTTDGLDVVIIYFNSTDSSTHIVLDPDAGVDGTGTTILLGNLTNITSLATHATLTAANIDSQS